LEGEVAEVGEQMLVQGLPVAVGGGEFEAAAGKVVVKPALGEVGEEGALGFSVAVALDVNEAPPQLALRAFAVPGGFVAECFEDAAAGGVAVADPPTDATWAFVAPDSPPFRL